MFDRDFEEVLAIEQSIRDTRCSDFDFSRASHIGSGTYNDVYLTHVGPTKSIMRLSYYNLDTLGRMQSLIGEYKRKYGNMNRASQEYHRLVVRGSEMPSGDPVRIKNNFARFTNVMCSRSISPHFAYSYGDKDCKNVAPKLGRVPPVRNRRSLSFRYNNLSFQEVFDMDLGKAIKRERSILPDGSFQTVSRGTGDALVANDRDIKSILFQVVYTLAVLQHYLPGFRHNDLSLANVLIKFVPLGRRRSYTYNIYGQTFELRQPALFVAVHDFDLAHADAYVMHMDGEKADFGLKNKMIEDAVFQNNPNPGVQRIKSEHNPSFDTNFLLHNVRQYLSQDPGRFRETLDWLKTLDIREPYPDTIQPRLIPANLLKETYFADMRAVYRPDSDFGIRRFPLEIHVPGIMGGDTPPTYVDETTGPGMLRDARGGNSLVTRDPRTGLLSAVKGTEYASAIFRYDGSDVMRFFDAGLIVRACQEQNPKVLEYLSDKLGVPYDEDHGRLCTAMIEVLQNRWFPKDDIQDPVARVYKQCSALMDVEDLVDLARTLGIEEDRLYVNGLMNLFGKRVLRSKKALCSIIRNSFSF